MNHFLLFDLGNYIDYSYVARRKDLEKFFDTWNFNVHSRSMSAYRTMQMARNLVLHG